MVYVLRRVTPEQLGFLRRKPEHLEAFLFDEAREAAVEETGLMDRLVSVFGFKRRAEWLGGAREEGDEIDLDKSWHLMHFLLAGSADATGEPESFLVEEWPEIGDVEVGWGRAWAIDAAAVERFDRALSAVEDRALASRYDTVSMVEQDVYLAEGFAGDEEGAVEYVLEYLASLRKFVSETAARGCAAIAYLS
ncbi:MAG TPA: DUF1877 family protein [Allosphingosinicella sp.]